MGELLLAGLILGLSAGLAPGPLLTLVIAETLRHDVRAGIRMALAPLLTDLPLILVTFLVMARLADSAPLLGAISLAGALFLAFMGYENLRARDFVPAADARPPASLARGALANVLNPYPYLFWFTVGGPLLSRAMRLDPLAPAAFLALFYLCLVGAKVLLAILVARAKRWVSGRALRYSFRALGLAMCLLALGLLRDGLRLLGWWPGGNGMV